MTKHLPPARGKHGLRFSYSRWYPQWESSTELSDSPFGQSTLKITVDGGTAWEPLTEDELALIDTVIDGLPELLPLVTAKLREWDENLQDTKLFRETFNQPSICLFEREEHPRRSWTFIVERLAFEGDNWGVHLEFVEKQFQDIKTNSVTSKHSTMLADGFAAGGLHPAPAAAFPAAELCQNPPLRFADQPGTAGAASAGAHFAGGSSAGQGI